MFTWEVSAEQPFFCVRQVTVCSGNSGTTRVDQGAFPLSRYVAEDVESLTNGSDVLETAE